MSDVTNEEIASKIREAYISGFTDGITRACEYYDITLREISKMSSKKLIESVDKIFKTPDEIAEIEPEFAEVN